MKVVNHFTQKYSDDHLAFDVTWLLQAFTSQIH